METIINKFGEEVTKWVSNKHPYTPNFPNPNFPYDPNSKQLVNWAVWVGIDGSVKARYHFEGTGINVFINNLTKEEVIQKYS